MAPGGGWFESRSFWAPELPSVLGDYFGMNFAFETRIGGLEVFTIGPANLTADVASILGVPSGLVMVKSKVVYDSVPPADDPLSVGVASVEMQGVSIDPNDLSGPVALRLSYDAYTDQFHALYALDGGGAWNLLGDPMQSTFSTSIAGTAAHGLYADPMFEPASVPEA